MILPHTKTSPFGGTCPLLGAFLVLCWIAALHPMLGETAAAQGICDRTPQVQDDILRTVGIESGRRGMDWPTDCAEVTGAHLALVRQLSVVGTNITALQEHDFRELVSLEHVFLTDNPLLTTLPEGIFQGLSTLSWMFLSRNSLTTLPKGIFHGLSRLDTVNLDDNSLTVLPDDIFHGLDNLQYLDFSHNSLSALPEGIFQGLSRLETLDSSYNSSLNTLPEGIYQDLDSLEKLFLTSNSLQELPPGIFRGLDSLKILWMPINSLSELPPAIFRGLRSLNTLYLHRNALTELPEGVFDGLDSLNELTLYGNLLGRMPPGIFDDVLDTLGDDYYIFENTVTGGGLFLGRTTRLAFDSAGRQVTEGAPIRVGVSLNEPSPVAIRVPYTVGLSRAQGGLEGLSPSAERGLLFSAGETRREITFTVPEQAGTQGARTVVLTLGTSSEIGIRRSDGSGPDAPYLDSEDLVYRRAEGAVHTVTVSDTGLQQQIPFCFSLWGGARCWTAAVLPHAVAGPLGGSVARTEVVLTNRDPGAGSCEAALLFGRGTGPAGAVLFNGRFPEGNLLRTTVPRGGARILTIEAPEGEGERTGAVHLFTRSPCSDSSLKVEGRILMENPASEEIGELVWLPSQQPEEWLGDGDCRVLTGVFGNGREVALSVSTAEPGHPAPPGTTLDLRAFDLKGAFTRRLPGLEINGGQQVLSTGRWNRPVIIKACLNVPGTRSSFRLAVATIISKDSGSGAQFGIESLPGGSGP